MPPLDPDVSDIAPSGAILTAYDHEHLVTYLRLLDAEADGADWRDVARIVLHLDPDRETDAPGRLTLNVLLSFAQFEREVTGVQAALMTAQGQSRPFRPVLLAH